MQELKPVVRSKFFRPLELVVYCIGFVTICVLLFPRGKLESYIYKPERVNVELSVVYMRNLLRIKDDPLLRLNLVQSLIQYGSFDEAQEEARKLINTAYRDKAYFVLYRAEKGKFFAKKGGSLDAMQLYLTGALKSTQDKKMLREIYSEAISMNLPMIVMYTAEKLYDITGEVSWLKEAYKYAVALGSAEDIIRYANKLYNLDRQNREKYINDVAYILNKERDLADRYLKSIDKNMYEEIISRITPQTSVASVSLEVYLKIFEQTNNSKLRKDLFKRIVQMYMWKGDYAGMKVFMEKYSQEFMDDKEMSLFILKSALASGDPYFASRLANRIWEVHYK